MIKKQGKHQFDVSFVFCERIHAMRKVTSALFNKELSV
jgi:hypothetical protein